MASTFTLKPTTTASDALASRMSDSEIGPTAEWIISRSTFLLPICFNAPTSASSEPWASHFKTRRRTFFPPAVSSRVSSVARCGTSSLLARFASSRSSLNAFAARSDSMTRNSSPAFGRPVKPSTLTGVEGPASLTGWPRSSKSDFTLPL